MLFKKKTAQEKLKSKLYRKLHRAYLFHNLKIQTEYKLALMFMVGIICFMLSAYVSYMEKFVYSRWLETTARVVAVTPIANSPTTDSEKRTLYTMSYSDGQNEHRVSKDYDDSSKRFSVGQDVPIIFNPYDPDRFRLNTDDTLFLIQFFIIMGSITTLVPGYFLFRSPAEALKKNFRKPLLFIGLVFLVQPFFFHASKVSIALGLLGLFLFFCSLALLIMDGIKSLIDRVW